MHKTQPGKDRKPFEKKLLHGQRSAARLLFPEEEMSESETAEVTEEWYETLAGIEKSPRGKDKKTEKKKQGREK